MQQKKEYQKLYSKTHREQYNKNRRNWNKKHPERNREIYRNSQRKTRIKAIKLLGDKCTNPYNFNHLTFEQDPDYFKVLQIDHINGGGNKEYKELGNATQIYRRVLKHPKDYQLLCPTCNWIKRIKNNE